MALLKHVPCGYVGDNFTKSAETNKTSRGTTVVEYITCPQCKTRLPEKKTKIYNLADDIAEIEEGKVQHDGIQEERS